MKVKKYVSEYSSAGTSSILRLCNSAGLFQSNRVVVTDSAFASVKTAAACKEKGLNFIGLVKTAHSLFPRKYLNDIAIELGESSTLVNQEKGLIAHAWNDKRRKTFIAMCGKTENGEDYKRKRYRFDQDSGKMQPCVRMVKRSRLAQDCFENAIAVHVNNHYRSLINMESIATKDWVKRMLNSIIGMVLSNAYLMYTWDFRKNRLEESKMMSIEDFCDTIAYQMLTNKIHKGVRRFSERVNNKRVDLDQLDADETETDYGGGCSFDLISNHPSVQAVACKKKQRKQLLCSISKAHVGYYCVACSSKQQKIVTVCGPLTLRTCQEDHRNNLL